MFITSPKKLKPDSLALEDKIRLKSSYRKFE